MNMMGNLGEFLCPIVLGMIVGRGGNRVGGVFVTAGVCLFGAVVWLLIDPVTRLGGDDRHDS